MSNENTITALRTVTPAAEVTMVPMGDADSGITVPEAITEPNEAGIHARVRHDALAFRAMDLKAIQKVRTDMYREIAMRAGFLPRPEKAIKADKPTK